MTHKSLIPLRRHLATFAREESGAATILALFFLLIFIVMGGIAIDFNRAIADRTHLQVTADTAAHAALYAREDNSAEEASTIALQTIDNMLPASGFGASAIISSDVVFGNWNNDTLAFTAAASSRDAVKVTAQMAQDRGNASRNMLLNIVGRDTFDIGVESVYTTYYPPCFTEGFVAEDVVEIQSNNAYFDGFCIHSNSYVSVNQNNFFEPGTVVSMPNLELLDMPNSGFARNEGLEAALREGEYRIRILAQLPEIIDSFWTGEAEHLPDNISPGAVFNVPQGQVKLRNGQDAGYTITPFHMEPYSVNRLNCGSSDKITMEAGTYTDMLFVTDCEVKFAQGVILEDSLVATTHTGDKSLNSPSDLTIGRDDACAAGGGATLMTLGGFDAAASMNSFGGQIIALGSIQFAANADGIMGASFVAGGRIDGTSNMNMGFCENQGMEHAYRAPYFRMVN